MYAVGVGDKSARRCGPWALRRNHFAQQRYLPFSRCRNGGGRGQSDWSRRRVCDGFFFSFSFSVSFFCGDGSGGKVEGRRGGGGYASADPGWGGMRRRQGGRWRGRRTTRRRGNEFAAGGGRVRGKGGDGSGRRYGS